MSKVKAHAKIVKELLESLGSEKAQALEFPRRVGFAPKYNSEEETKRDMFEKVVLVGDICHFRPRPQKNKEQCHQGLPW